MTREIRLLELELSRFKGVERFTLAPDGESVIVRGDNATGKSTLHDAYTWLLFGKDASNRTAFEIKTLTDDGAPVSGLDHAVAATFSIDGEHVKLRRVYRETWTKKRGASTAELTGHSTDFEVDGVPVKKKEWTERLDELFGPEDRLRLLTDPLYFASLLPWDQRRRVLLDLVGDVPEADVEALEPELATLRKSLGKRTHDEHAKVLGARRKEINGELSTLPVRVDEAARALEGAPTASAAELAEALANARAKVAELEAQATPDGALVTARAELAAARKRRELAIADVERERARAQREADRERATAEAEAERADKLAQRLARMISDAKSDHVGLGGRLEALRKRYTEVKASDALVDVEGSCPACGQKLPAERVELARRKAIESANARKADRLREISAEGQDLRERLLTTERDLEVWAEELEAARTEAAEARERAELAKLVHVPEAPELELAAAEIEADRLEGELAKLELGARLLGPARADTREADAEVDRLVEELAAAQEADRARARIAELEERERELAVAIEAVDRELYLLDLRARTRARLLTERVDQRFELVRFRLFTEQINGALAEACDVTVGGVPWNDLNHGARMNAGIDVLRVLGGAYGLRAPVWLDNAESVTRWRDAGAQTIRLEVDATATELVVEAA